ncbi:MAG: hypothetical protein HUJ31_05715, partial [Pseudomonadales bacterium]|nr:hypothetical protein [Pseudomonadales bacterium]
MRYHMKIDPKAGILRVDVEGSGTEQQEIREIEKMMDCLARYPDLNLINDRRKVTAPRTPTFAKRVAHIFERNGHRIAPRKVAILAESAAVFGMNRMVGSRNT